MNKSEVKLLISLIDDVIENNTIADFDDFIYMKHKDDTSENYAKSLREIVENNRCKERVYISDIGLEKLKFFRNSLLNDMRNCA